MGSAQTRPQGRVVQHGSLPLAGEIARVAEYLWLDDEDARQQLRAHLRQRATTLGDALGRAVTFDAAADALCLGFVAALNLALVPAAATAAEEAVAAARAPGGLGSQVAAGGHTPPPGGGPAGRGRKLGR